MVNGNHDMNNSYAADFTSGSAKAAWFMDNVRIPNWEHVTNTLADAGAVAVKRRR